MAILQILQYPDLRLRRKGYRVGNVKAAKIQKTIADMLETLLNAKNCAALAATQLAIEDPPHITVINSTNHEEPLCLINLQILSTKGSVTEEEGCMSVSPGNIHAQIARAYEIAAKALDKNGNELNFTAKGYLARCLQHEYDHLQGIIYLDHLSKSERLVVDKKLAELISAA